MTEAGVCRHGDYYRHLGSPWSLGWVYRSVAGIQFRSLCPWARHFSSHLCAVEVQLAFGSVPNLPVNTPSHLIGCPQDFSGLTFCRLSVLYSILEYKSGFCQQGRREGKTLCVVNLWACVCVCAHACACTHTLSHFSHVRLFARSAYTWGKLAAPALTSHSLLALAPPIHQSFVSQGLNSV